MESWIISFKASFFRSVGVGAAVLVITSCGSNQLSESKKTFIGGESAPLVLTAADYQSAAISATGTLTRKHPENAEIAAIVDQATYETYLNGLLDKPEFFQVMVKYHQDLFQNLGKNLELTSASNDPAVFGAYAATAGGVPYSDIITGDYCVVYNPASGTAAPGPCRVINGVTAAPRNSGVLTIPGLITHDFAAQHLRNAARSGERFTCTTYPDSQDVGRPLTEISPRYGGEMFGIPMQAVSQGPQCFNCHGALTNRSVTFRNFVGLTGSYNAAQTIEQIEAPFFYANGAQNPAGQTHSIANSTYKGVPIDQVWDLGREVAADSRFNECAAIRFYNWVFAKEDPKGGIPLQALTLLSQKFGESNRSVKSLLFALMSHKEIFVARHKSGGTP